MTGFLHLPGIKKSLQCVVGVEPDQDGNQWEHVSVKFCGTTNKTPSWEVMCQGEDVFWLPEEEVHQIHPKESEYLHGVGRIYDVLEGHSVEWLKKTCKILGRTIKRIGDEQDVVGWQKDEEEE